MADADEKVNRLILRKYREEPPYRGNAHLRSCPDVYVTEPDAYDGLYGCDTGCEYVRLEAVMRCPHGEQEEFEWGDFSELADLLRELDQLKTREAAPRQS